MVYVVEDGVGEQRFRPLSEDLYEISCKAMVKEYEEAIQKDNKASVVAIIADFIQAKRGATGKFRGRWQKAKRASSLTDRGNMGAKRRQCIGHLVVWAPLPRSS